MLRGTWPGELSSKPVEKGSGGRSLVGVWGFRELVSLSGFRLFFSGRVRMQEGLEFRVFGPAANPKHRNFLKTLKPLEPKAVRAAFRLDRCLSQCNIPHASLQWFYAYSLKPADLKTLTAILQNEPLRVLAFERPKPRSLHQVDLVLFLWLLLPIFNKFFFSDGYVTCTYQPPFDWESPSGSCSCRGTLQRRGRRDTHPEVKPSYISL